MRTFTLTLFLFVFMWVRSVSAETKIGVFYYPGWSVGMDAPAARLVTGWQPGWAPIKAFPEREPLLGWYKEGDQQVMNQHLAWMSQYGIDFIAFDWYWNVQDKTRYEHALNAYFNSEGRKSVSFALLWANHEGAPKNEEQMRRIAGWWARYYFHRPEYLRINGRPVVFVHSATQLENDATKFDSNSARMLQVAQEAAATEGAGPIYFVGGTGSRGIFAGNRAVSSGYSALSTYYNLQTFPAGKVTTTFSERDMAYREHWRELLKKSPLPVVLTISSGWDKRPWGGSEIPLADNQSPTPEQFESHLLAAKDVLNNNPEKNPGIAVLCCWNEFGEGSFIEPTKERGCSFLEMIRKVFGN